MRNDFSINGVGSGGFSCRLLSSYSIGSYTPTRTRVLPSKGLRFSTICTKYALLTLKLPVRVFGSTPYDAMVKESSLRAALSLDPVELVMPDGFYYTSSLDSVSESKEVTIDGCVRELTFTLSGFRHGALQTVTLASGATLTAVGTFTEMECRLTATVGAAASTYTMGSAVWVNVAAGDKLVLDGFSHLVTKNGANAISSCDLVEWPTLQAGGNLITCKDTLTVEYYPIWA